MGAGYIRRGGVGIWFGYVLWDLKIKSTRGRGGSYISSGIWGAGSSVFHWFLLSSKSKLLGGSSTPQPHIPNDTANNIKVNIQNIKRLHNN